MEQQVAIHLLSLLTQPVFIMQQKRQEILLHNHRSIIEAVPDGEGLRRRDGTWAGEVDEGVAFIGQSDDAIVRGEDINWMVVKGWGGERGEEQEVLGVSWWLEVSTTE